MPAERQQKLSTRNAKGRAWHQRGWRENGSVCRVAGPLRCSVHREQGDEHQSTRLCSLISCHLPHMPIFPKRQFITSGPFVRGHMVNEKETVANFIRAIERMHLTPQAVRILDRSQYTGDISSEEGANRLPEGCFIDAQRNRKSLRTWDQDSLVKDHLDGGETLQIKVWGCSVPEHS
jgi:hypothetical protein